MKIPKLNRGWLASWQLVAALAITGGSSFAKTLPYTTTNLDSDIPGLAAYTDPSLLNPWGVVTGIEGAIRVSDEGASVGTIYSAEGALIDTSTEAGGSHTIAIPSLSSTSGGTPTGIVDNQVAFLLKSDSNDFAITSGTVKRDAHFIFCTEEGVIAGFNPNVDPAAAITGTSRPGAGYTGASLSYSGTVPTTTGTGLTVAHRLFAANFEQGTVDVFNQDYVYQSSTATWALPASAFSALPAPPSGDAWSPFNIHTFDYVGQSLNNTDSKVKIRHALLVTYALHNTSTNQLNDIPEVGGTSYGAIAVFQTDGTFVTLLGGTDGELSSPWGIAVSHSKLPDFDAPIVVFVASNGTGTVSAYGVDPRDPGLDKYFGPVPTLGDTPLVISGLWGLHFATVSESIKEYESSEGADLNEDTKHFYFTAGFLNEAHGLLGKIIKP